MKPHYYSQAEDDILLANWTTLGDKTRSLLPHRTVSSLRNRAKALGLRKYSHWSEAEDAILCEHYPAMGRRCARMFPGRSLSSVISRAEGLGLKRKFDKPRAEKVLQPVTRVRSTVFDYESRDGAPMVNSIFQLASLA